jgi:hypothetical protein
MPSSSVELDAEMLRRCVRLGGLDITPQRAEKLLPLMQALLAGCDRLAALDLSAKGGSGALAPQGGNK